MEIVRIYMAGRIRRLSLNSALMLVIFVVLPFGLPQFGISFETCLAFTLYVAALLADGFTTKVGLSRGFRESNILYGAFFGKRMSVNQDLLASRVLGLGIGFVVLLLAHNAVVMLMFAIVALVTPLWNSMILSGGINSTGNQHIEQP